MADSIVVRHFPGGVIARDAVAEGGLLLLARGLVEVTWVRVTNTVGCAPFFFSSLFTQRHFAVKENTVQLMTAGMFPVTNLTPLGSDKQPYLRARPFADAAPAPARGRHSRGPAAAGGPVAGLRVGANSTNYGWALGAADLLMPGAVRLCTLHPVDPELESAWFQVISYQVISWFQNVPFKLNLHRYSAARFDVRAVSAVTVFVVPPSVVDEILANSGTGAAL
jgi:hypothetical protein